MALWKKNTKTKNLKSFFHEFRNRLDGIMTFGKLDKNTMLKIVGKFLVILKDMLKEKDVSVTIIP